MTMEIDAIEEPLQVLSDFGIENRYAAANLTQNASTQSDPKKSSEDASSLSEVTPDLMHIYYQRFFPYSMLYDWFRYGTVPGSNANLFLHREFSFTIEPTPGTEVYIRYQSFPTLPDFSAAIQKRRPNKIDIGAVFSLPPHLKSTVATSSHDGISAFHPTQREFVLDIDLTDYDDVRHCGCHSAQICPICWKFMYMAVKVIQTGLQDDFQFQHIQWFYSGRRGIHAWVCDETARTLTDAGRTAIANYFAVRVSSVRKSLLVWQSRFSLPCSWHSVTGQFRK
jgi:DNA primase small subunit